MCYIHSVVFQSHLYMFTPRFYEATSTLRYCGVAVTLILLCLNLCARQQLQEVQMRVKLLSEMDFIAQSSVETLIILNEK